MDGWICLHRKIRKNPIFNDLEMFRLWLICLTEASHTERDQIIGRQTIRLQSGAFITGRFDLHSMYNSGLKSDKQKSAKTIWRWLETLEKGEFLTINSTTKFSIISILNWDLYQERKADNDQQVTNKRPTSDQQTTNKRPTDDQQVTTNNNYNNVNNYKNDNKKGKKESRQTKTYDEESSPYKLSLYLFSKIREWTDRVKTPNFQQWADECRKILELDKQDKQLVKDVIDWATSDGFWQKNILSPKKLRDKFETLAVQMDSDNKKLKLVYSRGGETSERNDRESDSGGFSVGSEQNLDIFVRR